MAKKKTAKKTSAAGRPAPEPSSADAEPQSVEQLYEKVKHAATDRLNDVREKTVGDVIDGTLEAVRKHPGAGLVVAAAVGFFFGRLFGRWFGR